MPLKTKALVVEVAPDKLQQLADLSRALVEANKAEDDADKLWKLAKERRRAIEEEDIPAVMTELGVAKLKLITGEEITIKNDVSASITVERKNEAHGWLIEHGFGGLIITEVVVPFPRDQIEKAAELADELAENGFEPEFSTGVNAQTLKAFLREQLAAGKDIPMELFGARPTKIAKVKPAPVSHVEQVRRRAPEDEAV